MIAKITEANDQEYYAPRFEYITAELQKRDDLADLSNIENLDLDQPVTFTTKTQYSGDGIESSVAISDTNPQLYTTVFTKDTEAFRIEAHRNIVIDSIESYFANITAIGELYTPEHQDVNPGYLFLTMPADEDYFEIDANTRTISIPVDFKKNGVGVNGDHLAEMLVLKIDRYFDYQDLYNTKIAINWNFKLNGSREYMYEDTQHEEAFAPNDVLEPEYVVFGFPITKDMTPGKGTLEFSVSFYTVGPREENQDSDIIDYELNTMTASVVINAGLSLENPSEVKSSAAALRRRIQNSSYSAAGVSIPSIPEWRTGDVDVNSGKLGGLFYSIDFPMGEDGAEPDVLKLEAQAYSAGHVGPMVYNWFSSNLQGTAEIDESVEAMGVLGDVKKLEIAPADSNATLSQANQNAILVEQKANEIIVRGNLAALNDFPSTNPSQGTAKWIGLDIATRLDSIVGIKWNGYELTEDDVAESASIGLAANHIIFWAKAERLAQQEAIIVLSADGFNDVPLKVRFIDNAQATSANDFILAFVKNEDSNFEENHVYYIKNSSNVIDVTNRIDSAEKLAAVEDGTEVFELGTVYCATGAGLYSVKAQASKIIVQDNKPITVNSPTIDSIICEIPAAIQPEVTLSVTSDLSDALPEGVEIIDSTVIGAEPDANGNVLHYTYIDAEHVPVVEATVTPVAEQSDKKLGAIALEMILDENVKTLSTQDIEASDYEFTKVDDVKGVFQVSKEDIVEGTYRVRAINRRNHTYSVSGPSSQIATSFVAPGITDIDVNIQYDSRLIQVIENGESVREGDEAYTHVVIDAQHPILHFIIDNKATNNYDDAVVTYTVEEMLLQNGNYVVKGNLLGNQVDGPWDIFEIDEQYIADNEGIPSFDITSGDAGFFRIKINNRYHGTVHTTYTGVFRVVSGY